MKPIVLNASGDRMKVRGIAKINYAQKNENIALETIISPYLGNDDLIDWQSLQSLKIIPDNFPE